ncbi:hypothetical protein OHAE_2608 [Ochrobactrum soli]|uniref:Uncharacterized protein n=1 Tax=Ochrobactrum soli TaxID=2448455 RepID=A0A2P9HRL7_9HYPH|nr:hypothetical protein OHAE_2608 [[Ochrobactrum] soli]
MIEFVGFFRRFVRLVTTHNFAMLRELVFASEYANGWHIPPDL